MTRLELLKKIVSQIYPDEYDSTWVEEDLEFSIFDDCGNTGKAVEILIEMVLEKDTDK